MTTAAIRVDAIVLLLGSIVDSYEDCFYLNMSSDASTKRQSEHSEPSDDLIKQE